MEEVHAIFRGNVQGVGFRAAAQKHAKQKHVNGTVENLTDGTVEIYAQGEKKDLKNFIKSLTEAFPQGYVKSVSEEYYKSDQIYQDFKILN